MDFASPGPIRFDGQTVIVTGAAGGLGKAHALELAHRGAAVLIFDLGAGVADVVEEILSAGGRAMGFTGSVTNMDDCVAAVDQIVSQWERLDIVINNAGILRDHSLEKQTDAEWSLVLDVHLTGTRNMTLAAWPAFKVRKYGRVVNTTSASGLYGNFGQTNYSAAKMGIVGFSRSCALEGRRHGISVNCVAPVAHTPMTETLFSHAEKSATDASLVSPVVAYLASGENQETGVILACGGGYVARVAVIEAHGARVSSGETLDAEWVRSNVDGIGDLTRYSEPPSVIEALQKAFTPSA
ncbi:SDR family oxidoreductase [soil metagenome]